LFLKNEYLRSWKTLNDSRGDKKTRSSFWQRKLLSVHDEGVEHKFCTEKFGARIAAAGCQMWWVPVVIVDVVVVVVHMKS
jgi:hypothetical protein